jgi:GNAT superfamily N-acetyltransferase
LTLRRARLEDVAALARLYRTTVRESLPFLSRAKTADEDLSFFRDRLFDTTEIWIAEAPISRALLGYIAFRHGFIEHLFVRPDRQGRGLGLLLLQKAQEEAEELSLWTFQQNLAARRFYERNGFVVVMETDGADNEEKTPDVLYRWRRTPLP